MKKISKYLTLLIILVTVLNACTQKAAVTPIAEPTATVTLPTPNVNIDFGPDVEEAASAYMELWKVEDYGGMY